LVGPLEREAAAWERRRNKEQCTVDWRFTTADARIKLKRLYPSIQPGSTTRYPRIPLPEQALADMLRDKHTYLYP
jgi:hypothetical protein